MTKKEELWPKLIFPIFLIITFSFVYIFGPAYTGFHVYGGSGISNNLSLVFASMVGFILVFVVFKEMMSRLK